MDTRTTSDEEPLLLGAVDLGSNSFRVEVGRVEETASLLSLTGKKPCAWQVESMKTVALQQMCNSVH